MEDEDKGAEPTVPLPVGDESPATTTTTTTSTTTTDTTTGTETTNNSTTDSNTKSESPALIFAPGDHVIRWEMLPIAWPIQIHGIVLSVTDATLVLVDFGLTAAPQENTNGSTEAPTPTAAASTTTSPLSSSNRLDETTTAATTTEEATPASSSVEPASTESTTSNLQKKKPSIFSSDPKEMEEARKEWMEKSAATSKKILQSFQKLHPQTNKKRLNVIVLEDPAEWKKWKKVNYESGFFGFGKTNNNTTNSTTASDDGLDSLQDDTTSNNNNNNNNNNWWNKMKFGRSKKVSSSSNLSQQGDDTATESSSGWFAKPTNSSTTGNLPHSESGGSLGDATKQWWNKITNAQNTTTTTTSDAMDPTSSSQPPVKPVSSTGNGTLSVGDRDQQEQESSNANTTTGNGQEINKAPPPQLEMEMDEEETMGGSELENQKVPQLELEPEDTANDSEQKQEQKSPTAFMNPAMARLMESKKDEQQKQGSSRKGGLFGRNTPFFGKSKAKDTTTTETPQEGKTKKKLDLPKADPPKLVLARTRWLLQHGEAVLPPYHAFHSNSECIAVFCKTGYWSNLQADVFLHSTAIGNAKTMGAATLGVAASAPFLAPVIAGLGIGMVAAPWLILHSSKQQADDITLRMTEQFWAQAEPEVFVECIEHWSKLEEYYKRLESQKQDTPRVVTL